MTTISREVKWWPVGATEPRTLKAIVTLPVPHPSLGYQCTLRVEGFDFPADARLGSFCHSEGMTALAEALNMVPHVLAYHVRRAGGGEVTPELFPGPDLDLLEAERTLDYLAPGADSTVPIKVALRPPFQNHDETWTCTLVIQGIGDGEHQRSVQHTDSVGAILEALYLAPSVLHELGGAGRFTHRGSEELGFPTRT